MHLILMQEPNSKCIFICTEREYEVIVNVNDGSAIDSETLSIFVDEACTDTLIGYTVCLGTTDGGQNYNRD